MKELDEFLEKCKNGKDDVFIITSGGSFSGNVSSQNNDSFILEPAFNENIQSRPRIRLRGVYVQVKSQKQKFSQFETKERIQPDNQRQLQSSQLTRYLVSISQEQPCLDQIGKSN